MKRICRNCLHSAWLERPFEDNDGFYVYGFCRRMGQLEPIKVQGAGCSIFLEKPQSENENIEHFLNEMHKMLKELEDKYRKD